MKRTIATALIFLAALPATAGGIAPAIVEVQEVILEQPASSLAGWLVPLIILILIASMPRTGDCVMQGCD